MKKTDEKKGGRGGAGRSKQLRYLFASGILTRSYGSKSKAGKVRYNAGAANNERRRLGRAERLPVGKAKIKAKRSGLTGDSTLTVSRRDDVTGSRVPVRQSVRFGGARTAFARGELSRKSVKGMEREASVLSVREARKAILPGVLRDRDSVLNRAGYFSDRAMRGAATRKKNAAAGITKKPRKDDAQLSVLKTTSTLQKAQQRLNRAKTFKARDKAAADVRRLQGKVGRLREAFRTAA